MSNTDLTPNNTEEAIPEETHARRWVMVISHILMLMSVLFYVGFYGLAFGFDEAFPGFDAVFSGFEGDIPEQTQWMIDNYYYLAALLPISFIPWYFLYKIRYNNRDTEKYLLKYTFSAAMVAMFLFSITFASIYLPILNGGALLPPA